MGVECASPISNKASSKRETRKAYQYILLFAEVFIKSFKRVIARRGRLQKVYFGDGGSFMTAARWLRGIMMDERMHNYLSRNHITWQFHLSRAPWWGGQFQRLVGLVKQALYKSIRGANLTWSELKELILDAAIALNNHPLSYVEEDVQLPVLTPQSMMFGQPNLLSKEDVNSVKDKDLRKRARYLGVAKMCYGPDGE